MSKKILKKVLIFISVLILSLSLIACGLYYVEEVIVLVEEFNDIVENLGSQSDKLESDIANTTSMDDVDIYFEDLKSDIAKSDSRFKEMLIELEGYKEGVDEEGYLEFKELLEVSILDIEEWNVVLDEYHGLVKLDIIDNEITELKHEIEAYTDDLSLENESAIEEIDAFIVRLEKSMKDVKAIENEIDKEVFDELDLLQEMIDAMNVLRDAF